MDIIQSFAGPSLMSSNVDPVPSWVSHLGTTVYLNVGSLIFSTFYYGIYAILVCFAVPILCNREGNSRARIIILIAILTMFAISTFSVVIQAMNVLLSVQVFVDGNEEGLGMFRDKMHVPSGVEQILCFLTILIGDSVVIWRTWVLWSGDLKIVFIPCSLLLGTFASTFAVWSACR
ncbi:hypothetical protein MPER_12967 [Moniliophthora perniciosa FA553]|nr:hypothetical protein MPER_12967 [Moniliophthora perniciosa FA553]